jgi:TatD DNase family protein
MNRNITPHHGDYIDIHVHGGTSSPGKFIVETLMAHESRLPESTEGTAFTYGIHPWFLEEETCEDQLILVEKVTAQPEVIAIGEAGYDKLRGPSPELQQSVFEKQVLISEKLRKPLIIHCVRAWDELLASHRRLKPSMKWMIHGYRGKKKQAEQLLSKGFWLSIWFEYAMRPESAELFRTLPRDRFFLETDGADVDIRDIYGKVAADLGIGVDKLKSLMHGNYMEFFNIR